MTARRPTSTDNPASASPNEQDAVNAPHAAERQRSGPSIVKKYANRRLYNTATSSYVTLEELSLMVRRGEEFVVYDAKSNDDITRSVLTQIILEEDSKGRNLLPISFLRQVISFYDDSLHAYLPRYLELSMENFARHQDQMRGYVEKTFGNFFPVGQFEDMTRQNLALMQKAMSMFSPPLEGSTPQSEPAKEQQPQPSHPEQAPGGLDSEVQALKQQMANLQQELQAINRRQSRKEPPPDKKK